MLTGLHVSLHIQVNNGGGDSELHTQSITYKHTSAFSFASLPVQEGVSIFNYA